MSDNRHTYLATLFTSSTMDRWKERYAVTRVVYGVLIAFFAWELPEGVHFTQNDWGKLDVKTWAWITFVGSLLWNAYKSDKREHESRAAMHHLQEEALKKGPAQTTVVVDNDGPPKKGVEWGVNHGDNEDREFPEHHEGLHREEPFGSSVLGKLIVFNKKKP